jgi:predicted nuclease of predicted toxin-antitoxin system
MANLYADENFRYSVVDQLRLFGHDVLTVREAGRQGGNDFQVLTFATAAGRAVLTFDRRDFVRLHGQFSSHGGIIICTDDEVLALSNRIHQAIIACPVLANQLLRVNLPP